MRNKVFVIIFILTVINSSVNAQNGVIIENFDSKDHLQTSTADKAEISIDLINKGVKGKALKINYDLTKDHYVQIIRDLDLDLDKIGAFCWFLKGDANGEIIEIKLEDEDGSVFGKKIVLSGLSKDKWKMYFLSHQDCRYMWGGDKKLDKIKTLSIAISRGKPNKGYLIIDEFGYIEKDKDSPALLIGTIEDVNGIPLKNAECRLITSLESDAKVLDYIKTDDFGYYYLTNTYNAPKILSVNKWTYHPEWQIIQSDETLYKTPVKLEKCTIPDQIDKVELIIEKPEKNQIIKMQPSKNKKWSVKIPLKKGKYKYAFKINDELYPYPDFNSKLYKFNNQGDLTSIKKINSSSMKTKFTFNPILYAPLPKSITNNHYYNSWNRNIFWMEKTFKKAVSADQFLLDKVKKHKVVFLGEHHHVISPVLYLAKQLKKLYHKAHVRYLFLEIPIPQKDNALNCGIVKYNIMYGLYGWTYLYKEIEKINNKVSLKERLKVIYAEKGLKLDFNYTYKKKMKVRDDFIYKKIMHAVNNSKPEEKILIFYGSAHGMKEKHIKGTGKESFVWNSLGAQLYDKLKNRYYFVDFRFNTSLEWSFHNDSLIKNYYFKKLGNKHTAFEIKDTISDKICELDESNKRKKRNFFMDGMIVLNNPVCGILKPRNIKNKYTIKALIDNIKKNYLMILKRIFLQNTIYNTKNDLKKTCTILRMHLKDDFSYAHWNSKISLKQAILNVEKWYHHNKNKIRPDTEKEIRVKNKYANYRALANYPSTFRSKYLLKAGSYFPDDVDCYYLAYYFSKDKKKNLLKKIINHYNFYNCMNPKYSYKEMISLSEDKKEKKIYELKLTQLKDTSLKSPLTIIKGAYVFEVLPDSVLYDKLQFSDIIIEVNNKSVKNRKEFNKYCFDNRKNRIKYIRDAKTNTIQLRFKKNDIQIFNVNDFFVSVIEKDE